MVRFAKGECQKVPTEIVCLAKYVDAVWNKSNFEIEDWIEKRKKEVKQKMYI